MSRLEEFKRDIRAEFEADEDFSNAYENDIEWLIQQAERAEKLEMRYENTGAIFSRQVLQKRVEELEKENEEYKKINKENYWACNDIKFENLRYKRALEFYENPHNWQDGLISMDVGETAREALEEEE